MSWFEGMEACRADSAASMQVHMVRARVHHASQITGGRGDHNQQAFPPARPVSRWSSGPPHRRHIPDIFELAIKNRHRSDQVPGGRTSAKKLARSLHN